MPGALATGVSFFRTSGVPVDVDEGFRVEVVVLLNDAFPVFAVGEAAFTTGEFSGAPIAISHLCQGCSCGGFIPALVATSA